MSKFGHRFFPLTLLESPARIFYAHAFGSFFTSFVLFLWNSYGLLLWQLATLVFMSRPDKNHGIGYGQMGIFCFLCWHFWFRFCEFCFLIFVLFFTSYILQQKEWKFVGLFPFFENFILFCRNAWNVYCCCVASFKNLCFRCFIEDFYGLRIFGWIGALFQSSKLKICNIRNFFVELCKFSVKFILSLDVFFSSRYFCKIVAIFLRFLPLGFIIYCLDSSTSNVFLVWVQFKLSKKFLFLQFIFDWFSA